MRRRMREMMDNQVPSEIDEPDDEFDRLIDLSGIKTFEDITHRRTDLVALNVELLQERNDLRLEIGEAMENFRNKGRSKSQEWRRQRHERLMAVQERMMEVTSALTDLKSRTREHGVASRSKTTHPGERAAYRAAMQFVCICEERLPVKQVDEMWHEALMRCVRKSPILSPRISEFSEQEKAK